MKNTAITDIPQFISSARSKQKTVVLKCLFKARKKRKQDSHHWSREGYYILLGQESRVDPSEHLFIDHFPSDGLTCLINLLQRVARFSLLMKFPLSMFSWATAEDDWREFLSWNCSLRTSLNVGLKPGSFSVVEPSQTSCTRLEVFLPVKRL